MVQFLVAIHHPHDYDPIIAEDAAMADNIDRLNADMLAAGVRVFVGGLRPARLSKSVTSMPGGEILVRDGPYLKSSEHVGGFWVLDVADLDAALAWGRRAAIACRAPVEVRPFF